MGKAGHLQPDLKKYFVFMVLFEYLDHKGLKMYLTEIHINLIHLLQMLLQEPYLHHKERLRYNADDQHKFQNKSLVLHFQSLGSKMYTFLPYVSSSYNILFYMSSLSCKNASCGKPLDLQVQFHPLLFYTSHLKVMKTHKKGFDTVRICVGDTS